MADLLRASGHLVSTAGKAAEGIATIRQRVPDLVVCDLLVPEMDGYAFAAWARMQDSLGRVPLVAVTARAMVAERQKAMASGFDGYITKPIDPETFVEQIERLLPEQKGPTPAANPRPGGGHRATVLVVDDSPVATEVLVGILSASGYRVEAAATVADGLRLARQAKPDLILSDVVLQDEDGNELLRAVKADPTLRSIPFVFISTSPWTERDRAASLALGVHRFILRPIDPAALLAELESCLNDTD